MKMQTFRKPHQWLSFWLEKYAEALAGLKYSSEQRKQFWQVLKTFLETLPGNPRNVSLDAIRSFIEADTALRLLPVQLFYQHIAPSTPHLEMLKNIGATVSTASTDAVADPVERFRSMLSSQDFSERTVKNYCTAAAAYLRWLGGSIPEAPGGKIDDYCAYLTNEKQLAPRTVALHAAALKLFHHRLFDAALSDPKA